MLFDLVVSEIFLQLEILVAENAVPWSLLRMTGLVSILGTFLHESLIAERALKRQNIVVNPHVSGERPVGVEFGGTNVANENVVVFVVVWVGIPGSFLVFVHAKCLAKCSLYLLGVCVCV
jgi:hypothetical protein